MSKLTRVSHPIYSLLPTEVEGFSSLAERAHYELAAGREAIAKQLLSAMESFANESGLISEQVWDSPDIAARELHCGRPSGSAMPLAWAHADQIHVLLA